MADPRQDQPRQAVAVVGDADLETAVRRSLSEVFPRPDVRRLGGPEEVDDALDAEVVVVGQPHLRRSALPELEAMHLRAPRPALVLLGGHRFRAPTVELVRTGATDLLRAPTDDVLRDSLLRALAIGAARRRQPAIGVTEPTSGPRRVLTVASATGGCGKTFYALNLAYFLHHDVHREVCVIDFDLQFGEVSTALRLRPRATIADLVRHDLSDEELVEHLDEVIIRHESGIHVLPACREPSEADEITPRHAARIVNALRSRFDDLVVDTPSMLSEVVLAAFDVSDELVVLVTPDVPSVRNLHVFLQTLERLKVPSEHVSVIMNKAERNLGIDLSEVQQVIGRPFRMVLPYAREVSRSINVGVPVLGHAPTSDVARRLRTGMVEGLPESLRAGVDVGSSARARWGLLGRMRRPAEVPSEPITEGVLV